MSEVQEKEKFEFQTESKQIMNLVVHSLYSNKEIFLRELISNAADAADKLRFSALSDTKLFEDDSDLKVYVEFNQEKRTITIRDNAIGMTKEEVIKNLGTIAKSGTKEFLSNLTGDKAKDSNLIGQFGVGFYSGFIVADKITVRTRKAGTDKSQGVEWVSDGIGSFEVQNITKNQRGTEIILHIKEDEEEFLNSWRLRNIITKYADHISLPVIMHKELTEEDLKKQKEGEIVVPEEELINKAQALWTMPKSEISEEQYKEFYKHVAHDFEEPMSWSHNKVEGSLEYTTLLYLPSRAPFDLWHAKKSHGLKLYVQRVFIMDDAEQFVPNYLRFMKGVVDSNDLPLNVSREILQSNRVMDKMRSAIIKRSLSMLEDLSKDKEKYQQFWNEFGRVLKEGPAEDFSNKEQISSLLRFSSTINDTNIQNVSLDDYISRMKEGQKSIYYVAADSYTAAKSSPHLEIFKKKGIEVLLLSDKIDEWLISHLMDYKDKKLQSVAQGNLDDESVDDTKKEEKEKVNKEYEEVLNKMKELLKEKVKDIRMSSRLTDSPACVVADDNDMTSQMERLLKAAGQQAPASKPILELNPTHKIVLRLKEDISKDKFDDLSYVLFEQAILAEGGQLDDPASFVKRFNSLIN